MLHPTSKVKWIDTHNETGSEIALYDLFIRYSMYAVPGGKNLRVINFDRLGKVNQIKISDMFGYSDVVDITHKSMCLSDGCWVTLYAGDNHEVVISSDDCVPVYNMNEEPVRRANGMMQREYLLKTPTMIIPGEDYLRIRTDDNRDEYVPANVGDYTIKPDYKPNFDQFGYDIVTRSRFCNVNGVYMFAADVITQEEMDRYMIHTIHPIYVAKPESS